jgi:hypothetical protein
LEELRSQHYRLNGQSIGRLERSLPMITRRVSSHIIHALPSYHDELKRLHGVSHYRHHNHDDDHSEWKNPGMVMGNDEKRRQHRAHSADHLLAQRDDHDISDNNPSHVDVGTLDGASWQGQGQGRGGAGAMVAKTDLSSAELAIFSDSWDDFQSPHHHQSSLPPDNIPYDDLSYTYRCMCFSCPRWTITVPLTKQTPIRDVASFGNNQRIHHRQHRTQSSNNNNNNEENDNDSSSSSDDSDDDDNDQQQHDNVIPAANDIGNGNGNGNGNDNDGIINMNVNGINGVRVVRRRGGGGGGGVVPNNMIGDWHRNVAHRLNRRSPSTYVLTDAISLVCHSEISSINRNPFECPFINMI